MFLTIEIPKEFEEHFDRDRFEDSFKRIEADINSNNYTLSGKYESETIEMLRKAIKNGEVDMYGQKRA